MLSQHIQSAEALQLCSCHLSYAQPTRPKPARRACFSDSWARACWPLHQRREDCNAAPSRATPSTKSQRHCLGVKSGWIRDAASGTICASCINPCSLVAWKKVGVCGVRILLEEDGSGCFTLSAARRAPRTPEQRGRFVCSACCLVADSRGVAIRGVEVGVS